MHQAQRAEWELLAAAVAAVAAAEENERLRGFFRKALADTEIVWPGEIDILYEKCFSAPYAQAAAPHFESLGALLLEVKRLESICVAVHDRLLRGDDDRALLALAAEAWERPNVRAKRGQTAQEG
jgi:hypothetical protein